MATEKKTMILKDNAKTFGWWQDIAPTLLARDYKGWSTYGSMAVIEYERKSDVSTLRNDLKRD